MPGAKRQLEERGPISRGPKVSGVSPLSITASREERYRRGITTPVPRYDDMTKACERSVKIAVSEYTCFGNVDGNLFSCYQLSTSTSICGVRPQPSSNTAVGTRRLLPVSLDFDITSTPTHDLKYARGL